MTEPDFSPKTVEPVPIVPPPVAERVKRNAAFAREGEPRTRHSLPSSLRSGSPVGYRTRVPLSEAEGAVALGLLSLARPTGFTPGGAVSESELFDEVSLGVLTARQSTNFRGQREVLLGPGDSAKLAALLARMRGLEAPVLDHAAYTHVVLSRPYRTAFTLLLTFVGHSPLGSLYSVPLRAFRKRFLHVDDMPTIGYLQELHLGVLADAMERATILASAGRRRAQVFSAPFIEECQRDNAARLREIETLCGLSAADRFAGWRVSLVAQIGAALPGERFAITPELCRRLGANLLAFRSERVQPGVNVDEKAPAGYQRRQSMDVPEALTVMAGRAAYNAFSHWAGVDRERAKDLLLLDRIDVLTPGGKQRLRQLRTELDAVTDAVIRAIPAWIDLATGRALTRNAARGKKAFALAGQRIYISGLSPREIRGAGVNWLRAVRAVGAAAARAALVGELMGVVNLPDDCDLLAGICLMAGPVNQNDIGKTFFGQPDLLEQRFPGRDATSLLVWTLKAKTLADPIGNEEQLLNAARKGALVDLRPAPHEVVHLRRRGVLAPMRSAGGKTNEERAFSDVGNFVTDPSGAEIPGNRGTAWPRDEADPFGG